MLTRISVGLLLLNFALATGPAYAVPSDAETIKSMQALALESCARSDVQTGLKTFRSAIALAEKTFGKDSTYVSDLYYEAGLAAMKSSNNIEAENLLNKALSVNPNASEARLTLAEYHRSHGKLANAKLEVEQVLNHDPGNIQAKGILAATYQKEGNIAKALEEYGKMGVISQMPVPPGFRPMPASKVQPPAAPTGPALGFSRLPQPNAAPSASPAKPPAQPDSSPTAPPAETKPAPKAEAKPAQTVESKPAGKEHDKSSSDKNNKKHRRDRSHGRSEQDSTAPETQYSISGFKARQHATAKLLHGAKIPKGMVPPPPAVPTAIPVYVPPPRPTAPAPKPSAPAPVAAQEEPTGKAPRFKAAVPHVDTSDEKPAPERSAPEKTAPSSGSGGGEDDADFLLNWAGKKAKKK